ncbi:ras-related protein Rab-32B-like [Agrilus planipennis]|uniref:Ras-related protein Rab-32B-like n=1 Tax=Agrilus planipennis TaxID=224129 RepID=A0A1W4XL74_AGRPL|nr:ras-related protein Rab-32B-like [Agrilus planipennis]
MDNNKKAQILSESLLGQKNELLFKFLVIGDFGVGKTSIIKRYAEGTFSSVYKMTIGADFAIKSLMVDENTLVHLQLWDIAGNERFGSLTRVYYKYAVAAAIVFDLSRPETYHSVKKWLSDLRRKVTLQNEEPLPVVILANKGDVNYCNIPNEIVDFCKEQKILNWFITSAKENTNIEAAFECLLQAALHNHIGDKSNTNDIISLKKESKKTSEICCV